MCDGLVVDMLYRVKCLACYRLAKILTSIFLFQQSTQFFDMLDKMEVRSEIFFYIKKDQIYFYLDSQLSARVDT